MISSHLSFAHALWASKLHPGALAIDATCGTGQDSLFIASYGARLWCLDVQEEALEQTKKRLEGYPNVIYRLGCHSEFPQEIDAKSVTLVTYNLGYLPGGDKGLTTRRKTTMRSLNNALLLVKNGGLISVTCYPGHAEGALEEAEIIKWARGLKRGEWNVSYHQWLNRRAAPSVLLLDRSQSL